MESNFLKFISLKVQLRAEQDKFLSSKGLSLKKFIDAEDEMERDLDPAFTAIIDGYEVTVEESPNYLWTVISREAGFEMCKRQQVGTTKRIKIHKIKEEKQHGIN